MARHMAMDPAGLRNLGNQVVTQGNQFLDEIKSIFNIVSAIETGKEWHGPAKTQFVTTVSGYRPDMENLGRVIINYGNFLIKAANAGAQTEQNIAAAAARL